MCDSKKFILSPIASLLALMLLQASFAHASATQEHGSARHVIPRNHQLQLCLQLPETSVCNSVHALDSKHYLPQTLPGDLFLTEEAISFIKGVVESQNIPKQCREMIINLFCVALYGPCDTSNNLPMEVCEDHCKALTEAINCVQCSDSLNQLLAAGSSDALDLFFNLNCSDFSTYFWGYTESSNSSCFEIFSQSSLEEVCINETSHTPPYPTFECVPLPANACHPEVNLPSSSFLSNYFGSKPLEQFETEENSYCSTVLQWLICYYNYPFCSDESGAVIPICNESVDAVKSCEDEFIQLSSDNGTEEFWAFVFSLDYISNTTSCWSFDIRDSVTNQDNTIAAIVVTLFVLLVIVLFCVAVVSYKLFRHKSRRKRPDPMRPVPFSEDSFKLSSSLFNVPSDYVLTPKQDAKQQHFTFQRSDIEMYKQQFKTILADYTNLSLEPNPIGEGAFGKVYRGKFLPLDRDVAVKTIKNLHSDDELKSFFSETVVMKDFDHPNVMKLVGVCLDGPEGIPYIILDYMENGSLKQFLKKNRLNAHDIESMPENLSEEVLMRMCLDIARGMYYLACLRFVHRDLAARNCMVDARLGIKVGDFGLTRDVYMLDYYRMTSTTKLPVKWMPPETLMDKISNEKTDVWSFGVTCWEMFSLGIAPYPGVGNNEILQHVMQGNRMSKPTLCPQNLYDLLKTCWLIKPDNRPNFEQIVRSIEVLTEEYI